MSFDPSAYTDYAIGQVTGVLDEKVASVVTVPMPDLGLTRVFAHLRLYFTLDDGRKISTGILKTTPDAGFCARDHEFDFQQDAQGARFSLTFDQCPHGGRGIRFLSATRLAE